jgi:hypothetical protein
MKRTLIVGACLPVIIAISSIGRAAEMPDTADFIIYNAKVLTVNSNFTEASAIAVKGDRILAVGRDRKLEEYRGPETRIVDAQGRIVMPGLYDADVSSYRTAVSELKQPVPDIDSISNAQVYIRREASNTPAGAWIVLDYILPTRLKEGRLPTKDELDAATTNHPVLWNFGPNAVVNSKALEVSKIDADTQAPLNGEIVKEPRHRKPTGLLRNALSVLKLPKPDRPPTPAQERAALKRLYHLYNEQGITSISEITASNATIDLFRDMSRSNELTVRINCGRIFSPSADADESIDRLSALTNATPGKLPYGPTGAGNDWVRIGPLETMIDGNAGMGTAYLRTPYGIGPTYMIDELAYRGVLLQDAFALPQVYLAAAQQGWQLETHAGGDAALDFLLNCYEQVQFKFDIKDKRFLIAHSEFQAAQDWRRCQDLGVGVILRPMFFYDEGASLEKTLGDKRLTYYMPFKGWFDRGIVAGGGSGHFAGLDSRKSPQAWNPWLSMWTTLTRQTREGGIINPEEKLTREQAVRFYTFNNAWLHGEDNAKGSLEPGKLADLIMLDTDIMKCPVDDIRNTRVLFTMINGKEVWQAVEPIFPGPQVIPAVTINVSNQPAAVAAPGPVAPAVANGQSTQSAVQHAADATSSINPYAPVVQQPTPVAAAPVVATPVLTSTVNTFAPAPAPAVTSAPAPVTATVQPSVATTTTQSAPATTNVPSATTVTTVPAAQTSETTSEKTAGANSGSFTSIAGAAPAEVGGNQHIAQAAATAADAAVVVTNQAATTLVTNQGPSVLTNQVPNAISTNAASAAAATGEASVAATNSETQAAAPAAQTSTTTATTPATTSAGTDAANPATVTAAAATQTAAAATTSQTPAASEAPAQVAAATAPAATTTAPGTATTTPSTGTTNSAARSDDWSHLLPPGSK